MSTLSKRALDRIAAELREAHELRPLDGREETWLDGFIAAVEAVAGAAHVEMGLDPNGNRRFRWDRFLTASGLEVRRHGR